MGKLIVGIFDYPESAGKALSSLKNSGVKTENISLLARSSDELRAAVANVKEHKPDSAMTLLGIGGAITGLMAGTLVSIAIPNSGILLAAGPLLAAVAGAAAGGAIGIVAGALVRFDVPEYETKAFESQVAAGKVLVAVRTEEVLEQYKVEEIFDEFGAVEVDTKAA